MLFLSNRIRNISLAGLFVALSIVFARFFAGDILIGGTSVLRISFGPVPIYLSGMLLGPVYGAITGILADALGYLVKPLGPYFPGFTLNGALTGLIPALLVKYYRKGILDPAVLNSCTYRNYNIGSADSLWLSMMMDKAFIAFIPSNLISGSS